MVRVTPKEMAFYREKKVPNDPNFKGIYEESLHKLRYMNQLQPLTLRKKICKEVFMIIPEVIYTKKDFFLLDEFNNKIETVKAAGLIMYWKERYIQEHKLNEKETKSPKTLTLNHFKGCFGILGLGTAIALFVFICEVLKLQV
jgi:hypothetical protein